MGQRNSLSSKENTQELIVFACACARKSAMRASFHELDRVILEAVSEDYQSFEAVVSKLSQENDRYDNATDIERVLQRSIASNFIAAYLLHADPPYATEVGANSDNIRRYWFCITEKGREYLGRMVREQAVFPKGGTR